MGMIKLGSYQELVKLGKEKLKEALIPIRALQMRKKGEAEILGLEEQLMAQETKITELCAKDQIDFKQVLDAIDQYELLERRKRKFVELLEQLFPQSTVVTEAAKELGTTRVPEKTG